MVSWSNGIRPPLPERWEQQYACTCTDTMHAVHAHTCTCLHTVVHIDVHTRSRTACSHLHMQTCMHTLVACADVCTHSYLCAHVFSHSACMHTCAHALLWMHVHIHVPRGGDAPLSGWQVHGFILRVSWKLSSWPPLLIWTSARSAFELAFCCPLPLCLPLRFCPPHFGFCF